LPHGAASHDGFPRGPSLLDQDASSRSFSPFARLLGREGRKRPVAPLRRPARIEQAERRRSAVGWRRIRRF
jgi:hypothetical protein